VWDGDKRDGTVRDGQGRECLDDGLMVTLAKNGKGTVMVTGQNHNFYSSINIVKFNFLK
jgi:hypothetical protein